MFERNVDRSAGNMNVGHSGKKRTFIIKRMDTISRVAVCAGVLVCVTSMLHEMIHLSVCLHLSPCSLCLHTCCMN